MLLQQLREETREQHAGSERALMKKFRSIRNADDYTAILRQFHEIYQPVEAQIHALIPAAEMQGVEERAKSPLLRDELQRLGAPVPQGDEDGVQLLSFSEAVGALYVIEGSTLGGQVISSMLSKHYPELKTNYAFFNPYGEQTAEKWAQFRQQVTLIGNKVNSGEAIAGAKKVFNALCEKFTVNEHT